MKKYFFVSFKAFDEKKHVGGCSVIVICSCSIERIEEALLDDYNKRASHKADKVIITSLIVLDKQTAAQLSKNFTNSAMFIDDGEKEDEENEVDVGLFLARDKNNRLFLYIDNNEPKRESDYWACYDGDCAELEPHLFPEVQWSDEEPTKVKLVIDK